MNNKVISIIIVFLYFANYHICEIIYPDGGMDWLKLRVAIYCTIILLSFEYKKQNTLIEKVFLAVIFNNIYVLLFNNETNYTIQDVIFVCTFTAIQYIKQLYNLYKKWSSN